jgi:LysM repeat protein
MKILKIAGIVAGIHAFFLLVIFANPGCSSTTKPAPTPADTVASSQPPVISVPGMSQSPGTPATDSVSPAPVGFNPDAPASYADSAGGSGGVRFTPTRPNTPAASAVLQQPVENVTPATTYTVKSGDSLWALGKKFHIDYKEIAAANNMSAGTVLHEGQKLIIPSKTKRGSAKSSAIASTPSSAAPAPARAASAAATHRAGEMKYTVKSGDTLGGIAHNFGVSVRELAVANSIADPLKLRPGTELTIPGWREPASSGGGASRSRAAAASTPAASTSTMPEQPGLSTTEPAPAEPTPTETSTVPVINIDENPVTPTPNP